MANVGEISDLSEVASVIFAQSLLTPFPIFWATVLFLGFFLLPIPMRSGTAGLRERCTPFHILQPHFHRLGRFVCLQ